MRIKKRSKKGNHFTEQYKYIEDVSQKINIIKMENLNSMLKKLFKYYHIDIKISNIKKNIGKKGPRTRSGI